MATILTSHCCRRRSPVIAQLSKPLMPYRGESQSDQHFDWIIPPASSTPQHRSPNLMPTSLCSHQPVPPSSPTKSGITEEHPLFSQIEDDPYTKSLLESVASRQEQIRYRRNIMSFSNGSDPRVQRRPTIRMPHVRRHDANKLPTLSESGQTNNEPNSVTDLPTEQVPEEQASLIWHEQPLQPSPQYLLSQPPMAPDPFAYDPFIEFQDGNPS